MRRFKYTQGTQTVRQWVERRMSFFGPKLAWFFEKGYRPHLFQASFHLMCEDRLGRLLRHRCLVAGRRGGKTLSAAWEVTFYCLHPTVFHWDVHRKQSDEPLHVWVLVPDFKTSGRAAMRTLRKVFQAAGLVEGKDYKWNKGELYVEFANNTFLEFKTAESAENLVGAGIDILWIDEAALIPNETAYEYAAPALDDKLGVVICTTTPRGKNWFFKQFWGDKAQNDETIGSVEYRSIDNPYYPREAWVYRKRNFHPMRFLQEMMAAFDAQAGKEFSAEWLSYYSYDDLPLKNAQLGVLRDDGRVRIDNLDLDVFIGIDPAISMSERADFFAWCVLGVKRDRSQAYILEVEKTKIPFPEQVSLLQRLNRKWRPYFIGVDTTVYQAALAQQAARLQEMPSIVPQPGRSKKSERIIAMSPSFKVAKVQLREEHVDFIDQWINYDPEIKNPEDDILDATEIAMQTAGILLPGFDDPEPDVPQTVEQMEWANMPKPNTDWRRARTFDEHMGDEW